MEINNMNELEKTLRNQIELLSLGYKKYNKPTPEIVYYFQGKIDMCVFLLKELA